MFCTFISIMLLMNYSIAQGTFGIAAGATFASYKASGPTIPITAKNQLRVGFTAGVTSSFSIGKSFNFEPALNFLQKGGDLKDDLTSDKLTLNYLELPLNFVYKTHGAAGEFFAGAGLSLSLGLSGKDKFIAGTYPATTNIKFGTAGNDDFKPLEFGINILAGYQLKNGLRVAANYNAGLNNILNTNGFDQIGSYHNRYFGIRIGYMFKSKKK